MRGWIALFALCGLLPATSFAAPQWPSGGEVVYEVLRGEGGMKLGEGVHVWQHDGARYEMSTRLQTTGLAGLLLDFEYEQSSQGLVTERGLRPQRFLVEQKGRESERATFDWQAGSVLIERRKGRRETASISAGDLDVLSVWHLASLRGGRDLPAELTLISNRRATPAALRVAGIEEVELPLGRVKTLHVTLRAPEGKLSIDLWLSETHAWVPVRILMRDDKNQVLDQRALSIRVDVVPARVAGAPAR